MTTVDRQIILNTDTLAFQVQRAALELLKLPIESDQRRSRYIQLVDEFTQQHRFKGKSDIEVSTEKFNFCSIVELVLVLMDRVSDQEQISSSGQARFQDK